MAQPVGIVCFPYPGFAISQLAFNYIKRRSITDIEGVLGFAFTITKQRIGSTSAVSAGPKINKSIIMMVARWASSNIVARPLNILVLSPTTSFLI